MAKTYEAMQRLDECTVPEWETLDLQHKKQAGDIYKKITNIHPEGHAGVFSFTSCRAKEGVTTVLLNLLRYIKQQNIGKKILVIDANMQAPALHSAFRLRNAPGLSDILNGRVGLSEGVQKVNGDALSVILSGEAPEGMFGGITYEKFNELICEAKPTYDYILIDSAPILTSTDFLSSSGVSDAVFMVIQSLKVQREAALKAKSLLLDNNCIIGGVILNRVQQVIPAWLYNLI